MSAIKVFISYSHDTETHRENVLALSERLREDGIETILDQHINGSPTQGWPRWMMDQLDVANFVLVICTETYYRRFRGHEEPGKGKGVDWEGALITQDIYDARSRTLKFVPVFLSDAATEVIPDPLRSIGYHAVTSESAYQNLYDFLLGQAGVEARPIGTLKIKPRKTGTPLTFDHTPSAQPVPADISRILDYVPAELLGREAELALLTAAWGNVQSQQTPRPHVLAFVAMGGEGKTSLVAKWAAELAANDWPGCEAVFAWSFYSQGTREQNAASSDAFLNEALTFFGEAEMAASAAGAFEKGQRLARVVGQKRALLILDGLEPLQYAPTSPTPGELKDQGLAALLKGLATGNRGLCVITTRYAVPDLNNFLGKTVHETRLQRLATAAGVALLKHLGVRGSERKTMPADHPRWNEYEQLVEDVQGHALTLNLLGTYLRDAHNGDIRRRDRIKLSEADAVNEHRNHAWHVMDAYVQWMMPRGFWKWLKCFFDSKEREIQAEGKRALALLSLLGLFDRPATADCLAALWQAPAIAGLAEPLFTVEKKWLGLSQTFHPISETERNLALKRLEDARLLTVNRDEAGQLLSLDAHPLVREYFGARVKAQQPDAWRAAHHRLYEHLCATTADNDQPTLADLQPLYQAVAHGCQAGLQQEACVKVYRDRILRGTGHDGFYSTKKLGAFGTELGAVACFFETPWSRVSPALTEADQAWLLNEAAFRLRGLGRLRESLEPMRATMEINANKNEWKNAAVCASNLSELELTLGLVDAAVQDAAQSVEFADRSGDAFVRLSDRTAHADALHQAGRLAEAETRFDEAEQIQAEDQPEYPLLYSLQGFQYCDLLLAQAEHAAWQLDDRRKREEELLAACRAVSERAETALQIVLNGSRNLLDIALNHLTLGRSALYATLLEASAIPNPHPAIEAAVSGLRRSGYSYYLPLGLLTRAWLRAVTGALTGPDSAQADLDEAWDIAARGSMKLHLADIHLYRARLFGGRRDVTYPWDSPAHDLSAAARLIHECGYHRRDEELRAARASA